MERLIEASIVRIVPDNPTKVLTIELRSADGGCIYAVRADGVYDLLIEAVRLNNIVDEVVGYPESMSEAEMLSSLQFLMTRDSAPYELGRFPHVDLKAEEIRGGTLRLWNFRPVYGASLFIVARTLAIIEAR